MARPVDVEGSRPEWDELRQSLRGYGNLAALLAEWHRAYMLAGARRLLDDSKGVSSPIRALRLVSRHADKVTLDVLAAGFAGNQYETQHRRHLEEHLIELAGGPALTATAVNAAINDLRAKHDEVTQLARDSRPPDTPQKWLQGSWVSFDAVDEGQVGSGVGGVGGGQVVAQRLQRSGAARGG